MALTTQKGRYWPSETIAADLIFFRCRIEDMHVLGRARVANGTKCLGSTHGSIQWQLLFREHWKGMSKAPTCNGTYRQICG